MTAANEPQEAHDQYGCVLIYAMNSIDQYGCVLIGGSNGGREQFLHHCLVSCPLARVAHHRLILVGSVARPRPLYDFSSLMMIVISLFLSVAMNVADIEIMEATAVHIM